jgi:hypothetical protein
VNEFGGTWYAISPTGTPVTEAPASGSSSPAYHAPRTY